MRTVRDRFFEKVEQPANGAACWPWTAARCSGGYGNFYMDGWVQQAHRASWKLFHGEIPDGLFVLHKCDNKRCVNPDHFFLGTHQDNADDKMRKGRHTGKNKTNCKRGHPLAGDNIYQYGDGRRICKECLRIRGRIYAPTKKDSRRSRQTINTLPQEERMGRTALTHRTHTSPTMASRDKMETVPCPT